MQDHISKDLKLLSSFVICSALIWTIMLGGSLFWNINHGKEDVLQLARLEARTYFDKDQAFRLWATSHGGLYVKVDDSTPPNPHLNHIPERDITTPSGQQLTLMNPAYMLRQLMEEHSELYGVKSKITSLKALNPINTPDPWEKAALKAFENGQPEISKLTTIDDLPYLRFIRPMITKKGCLKCHEKQGYSVGDVRGGVAVAIPMSPYWATLEDHKKQLIFWHLLLWSTGLSVLFFLTNLGKQMIITRGKLEEERENSSQQMALILESLNEGVFGLDPSGKCTFVNAATLKMCNFNKEELLNKCMHHAIHHTKIDGTPYPPEKCPISDTIKTGITSNRDNEVFWKKDGTSFPVTYTVTPTPQGGKIAGGVVIFRDLTLEQRKAEMEKQLWQAQKLESIGTLAGGIAHDFNNILAVILGYSDLALDNINEDNQASEDIKQIQQAGNRAKNLVQQILTFSRQTEEEFQPLKIQPVIKECLKLLRASIPTTIEIQQDIDPACGEILGDPTKIHQIIMNLCTNAYHAMREQGGIIKVSLSEIDLAPEDLGHKFTLTPGKHLQLIVSDTGSGIDDVTLKKIFDPYFTTKDKGDGTGLGLAIVHGIVKNLNGIITVYSEIDEGTTFHIYIPEIHQAKNSVKKDSPATAPLPQGTERIMVVDDEEAIAQLLFKMLTSLGYKVTPMTSSFEALETFQKNPGNFDLILTDMTMPKMTGMELCEEIIKIRPDMPIIISTGFSELITDQKAKIIGARRLIMKPVIKSDMAKIIREVLDENH